MLYSAVLFSTDFPQNHLGEREREEKQVFLGDPVLLMLAKDLGNVQDILADFLKEDEHFKIPFESPIKYPRWQYVLGPMSQIDGGADGTLFGVNAKHKVFKYVDNKFAGLLGQVSQISVGDKNNVCALGPGNHIYKLGKFKKWRALKGRAKHISCGSDGTIVGIYTDEDAKKYKLKVGSLVMRKKGKWINLSGQLNVVSVGSKNNIWGLKSSGSVWFFNGKKWERKPGVMEYISAASDGTVAAVGKNGGAYLWDGVDWVNVSGVNLVLISAQANGKYWAITADGSVWKSIKE